jgi:hypothetical protein
VKFQAAIEYQCAHKCDRFKQKSRRVGYPTAQRVFCLTVKNDQSAAFAETDFSDDDLEREDGLDSVDDDFDSFAGFDSLAGFEDESLDDAVAPLVAGFSVVDADSESVLLGVLFLA